MTDDAEAMTYAGDSQASADVRMCLKVVPCVNPVKNMPSAQWQLGLAAGPVTLSGLSSGYIDVT